MPWYTDHIRTCKVLNRIARHYEQSSLTDLKIVLDRATETLWRKKEHYYTKVTSDNIGGIDVVGQCDHIGLQPVDNREG